MAILKIRKWGDPILKTRAAEITEVTEEIRRLAADLLDTMRSESGVGLAANQTGVGIRLFVAEVLKENGPAETYALVNPRLVFQSKQKETKEEGCLSFPGIYGKVERALDVEIEGKDLDGHSIRLRGHGLLARAFQHEMDHLDGIVFIERMGMAQRLLLKKTLAELASETRSRMKKASLKSG